MTRAPSHRPPRPRAFPIDSSLARERLVRIIGDQDLVERVIGVAAFGAERAQFFRDSRRASESAHRTLKALTALRLTSPSATEDERVRSAVAHYFGELDLLRRAHIAQAAIHQVQKAVQEAVTALSRWDSVLDPEMLDGRLLFDPVRISAALAVDVAAKANIKLKSPHLLLVSVAAEAEKPILSEEDLLLRRDKWKKRMKTIPPTRDLIAALFR